jgi:hypothetical protein
MGANPFYRAILDTLQGQTDQLRTIPPERLDWAGPGAFLELYRTTSGTDRTALIRAVGQIIEDQSAPLPVLAQLIQLASSLDLAEVEPQIRQLQAQAVGAEEPLRGAINNYLAFRQLIHAPKTAAPPQAKKGQRSAPKARSTHGGNGPAQRL